MLQFIFGATIFLGAFLLFLVQPMLGKHLLPFFGGTASVWTTCMLFFQVNLLLGYLYSHLLVNKFRGRRSMILHGSLLIGSIGLLIVQAVVWSGPLLSGGFVKTVGQWPPVVQILLILGMGIGLPYLLLASTSPLIQAWFHQKFPGRSPYRLFALSNADSLLGLLAYPFGVER